MEYKTAKDYNNHKDLITISVYENGKIIQKSVALTDITFNYKGNIYKGEQIIKNKEEIDLINMKIRKLAETIDKYIAQQDEAKKLEGALF